MRKLRVDRMLKNLAKQTPDSIVIFKDRDEIVDFNQAYEWSVERVFDSWCRLIALKHEANPDFRGSEVYVDFLIDYNRYKYVARAKFSS